MFAQAPAGTRDGGPRGPPSQFHRKEGCYCLSACFNWLPAENFGTRAAGIVTFWPVRGFTPCRSLRCWGENLPKPVNATCSPPLRASVIESRNASTAFVASRFESPLFAATLSVNSAFVTALSFRQRSLLKKPRGPEQQRLIARNHAGLRVF